MFVNDLKNFVTYDAERNLKLRSAGLIKDEDGEFFVLYWGDKAIPFQAKESYVQHPDKEWWWVDWVILSMGVGPHPFPAHGPGPQFRSSFRYHYLSAEEEWSAVDLIKEALTAYGCTYGLYPGEGRNIVVKPDAWKFPENRERAQTV